MDYYPGVQIGPLIFAGRIGAVEGCPFYITNNACLASELIERINELLIITFPERERTMIVTELPPITFAKDNTSTFCVRYDHPNVPTNKTNFITTYPYRDPELRSWGFLGSGIELNGPFPSYERAVNAGIDRLRSSGPAASGLANEGSTIFVRDGEGYFVSKVYPVGASGFSATGLPESGGRGSRMRAISSVIVTKTGKTIGSTRAVGAQYVAVKLSRRANASSPRGRIEDTALCGFANR